MSTDAKTDEKLHWVFRSDSELARSLGEPVRTWCGIESEPRVPLRKREVCQDCEAKRGKVLPRMWPTYSYATTISVDFYFEATP